MFPHRISSILMRLIKLMTLAVTLDWCVFWRGVKYPERIMNSTKSSTSIMFACTADGKMLNPYIVYKAEHLHDQRIQGGSRNVRYNRSRSGWFDSVCFSDWFAENLILLSFTKNLTGRKVIISDNFPSHFFSWCDREMYGEWYLHNVYWHSIRSLTFSVCRV